MIAAIYMRSANLLSIHYARMVGGYMEDLNHRTIKIKGWALDMCGDRHFDGTLLPSHYYLF